MVSLTEGIAKPEKVQSVELLKLRLVWMCKSGWKRRPKRLSKRRRTMAGPVGCGLCGIDSLEEATRVLCPVPASRFQMTPSQIMAAVAALPAAQPLHDLTRAVHAAGFYSNSLIAVREDVGRHNALDKLCGHLIRTPHPAGAVVLTSRVSIDMVQKVAALGASMLIAVSAPPPMPCASPIRQASP